MNLSCEIIWAPAENIYILEETTNIKQGKRKKYIYLYIYIYIYICWRSKTEAGTYGPESFPILTKSSMSTGSSPISGLFFKYSTTDSPSWMQVILEQSGRRKSEYLEADWNGYIGAFGKGSDKH